MEPLADYIHLTNIIQGEVIRIRERRAPEEQPVLLQELIEYLQGQVTAVTIERLRVTQELSEG
jgi:hypothetical protein